MKIAALTMVFNERHFLPMWLHHYGRQLGYENLYIIDDGSDDGSTQGLGPVRVMRQAKAEVDEDVRAEKTSQIQAQLLTQYDAVIVADVDELLVPDPALGLNLVQYTEQRVPVLATATGFNVHHNRFVEPALVVGQPLFRQRHFVQFDWGYCKTLLSRVPLHWGAGFHYHDKPTDLRSDLYIFHLRAVDYGIARERVKSFARIARSSNSQAKQQAGQFSLPPEGYLRAYFHDDVAKYQAALPADKFDAEVDRVLDLLRHQNYVRLEAEREGLMRLPDRFADCIAVTARR